MTDRPTAASFASILAGLGVALALAGCTSAPPRSHASAVTEAVCRQRAEQVYTLRNPGQVYSQDNYFSSTRDAPFATSGISGATSRTLSDRYQLDQLVNDCISGTGSGRIGPTPAAPPPQAPAPSGTAAPGS
jgi:hypothetical protein